MERLYLAAVAALVIGIALGGLLLGGRGGAATVTVEKPVTTTLPVTSVSTVTSVVTETVTSTTMDTVTSTVTETVEAPPRLVLVDALGRVYEAQGPAARVASLAPSITESMCMLGLCDRIVAADSISLGIEGVPVNATDVGGYWGPSAEKIIKARPDLVLACSGVPAQERMARLLEEQGVPVFFLRCDRSRDWADIEWDASAVAELLGVPEKGRELVSWMESVLDMVRRGVANETPVNVTLVVYYDPKGLWVAGGGTFQDTMVSTAGGVNVFGDRYGWGMVSFEDIVARNPGFIVVTAGSRSDAERILGEAAGTPLAETAAWKSGGFCVVYGDAVNLVNRPSPRAVLGAQLLASLLHPGAVEPPEGVEGYVCGGGG